MSIEKLLEDLTAAIKELTLEIRSTKAVDDEAPAKPAKAAKAKPVVEEDEDEAPAPKARAKKAKAPEPEDDDLDLDDDDKITTKTVKDLAKKKIEDGADRSEIKKMISKLGGESIADLDQKKLEKLYTQLEDLD